MALTTFTLSCSHHYHPSPECSYISGSWWIHSLTTHVITGQVRNPRLSSSPLIPLPIFSSKLAAWLLPRLPCIWPHWGCQPFLVVQSHGAVSRLCLASALYHLGSCFSVLPANLLLCYFCNTFSLGFPPTSWVFWCLLLVQKLIPTPSIVARTAWLILLPLGLPFGPVGSF